MDPETKMSEPNIIDLAQQDYTAEKQFPVLPEGGVFGAHFTCETGEDPETVKYMEEQNRRLFEALMQLPPQ
jgi:hypothetical protein